MITAAAFIAGAFVTMILVCALIRGSETDDLAEAYWAGFADARREGMEEATE